MAAITAATIPISSSSSSSSSLVKPPQNLNPSFANKTHPFLFPPLTSKPPFSTTVLCHSTTTKSHSPPAETTPNPSLSDQLRPLSLTLLKDHHPQLQQQQQGEEEEQTPPPPSPPPQIHLSHKPKSTWINPSRPKPKVLSLRRHPRASPSSSHNPDLKHLPLISRAISVATTDNNTDFSALSAAIHDAFPGGRIPRDTALLLLNSLRPWQRTYAFFNWLKLEQQQEEEEKEASFAMETIFYNVVMKSLRFGRQYELVEALAAEMLEKGIELDNITYSTIITCAKRCRQFDRAIEWFEGMYKTGLMPDEVTYSAILDVYAQLGKVEEVISLYERARASGWKPDAIAFSVLGKMFGEAGDYDGIRYVLQEMKGLGVEPNLVVYNTLLEAMGKAGKPGLARNLFDEMITVGLTPNEKTLTALIKIYGKARWSKDALELWGRMKSNGWPMDFILYNTLLSMCADVGLEQEAEELFADMKASRRCRPDSFSYTAMINIHASLGKGDKALELFEEMLNGGVEPNVMGCTCLIQCLGKARRIDDAVRMFGVAMERGVVPDDRLCGCLLSVVAFCGEGEIDKVLPCLEKANPRLVKFVKLLGDVEISFDEVKQEFRGILNETADDARRPFCNCLIDVCRNQNFPVVRAHELFHLGNVYGLYPGLHIKVSDEWSLNLRSLSIGAAHVAFEDWVRTLWKCVDSEEEEVLPRLFSIHTGTGTHKFSQGLASTFASHLEKLAAPFRSDEDRGGCFVSTREDLISWVQIRGSQSVVAA